jgi:hypothetical protein
MIKLLFVLFASSSLIPAYAQSDFIKELKAHEEVNKENCNSKSVTGCTDLGTLRMLQGKKEEGIKYIEQSCNGGLSCDILVKTYESENNISKAIEISKRQCDKGDAVLCYLLSQYETKAHHPKEAEAALKKACGISFSKRKCVKVGAKI